MIKIGICDDDMTMTGSIEEMLHQISGKNAIAIETYVFNRGREIEEKYFGEGKDGKYDLVYLAIQLKDRDGISIAKNIRKVDENVLIIYISAYEKYLKNLFEVDTFDFIKKPIDKMKFEKCFLRAYGRICTNAIYFECQYKKENIKVPMGEIIYFESVGRKVFIHLEDNRDEKFNGKLDDVEEKIKKSKIPFLRIHQSYMVSFHQIRGFSRTHVRMKNGTGLPISGRRYAAIIKQYSMLLGEEVCE